MKSKSRLLPYFIFLICSCMFMFSERDAFSSSKNNPKLSNPHYVEAPSIALQFVQPSQRPKEVHHIEPYIPRTINYGLSLALPSNIHKGLDVDAGWDRINNSPTFKLDYFLPVRGWNDVSVFLSPRASLNSSREGFSFGGGVRHLLTSETMLGFHAYQDWLRPRNSGGEFMKETIVGMELSALPGYFSDLKISGNVYLPNNVRESLAKDGVSLFKESLPAGGDVSLSFLLPPVFPYFDIRLDGQAHTYKAPNTDVTGHRGTVSINSRDGMFNANFQYARNNSWGESYAINTGINLAFDWNALLNGNNPFSAPYKAMDKRYSRKMRDSLYSKVSRKHDLPVGRSEIRSTLMASITGDTVTFTGGFPDIPNATVTVQVSQSPWRDCMEVSTDEKGSYYGMISLPPGTCKLRLIHKPTGRSTEAKTVMIAETPDAQQTPLETNSWRITPEF
ncbi:MAG: carboxypeptidase-like regulatory domain-containing protein [Desulfomonilaceae bacterium]